MAGMGPPPKPAGTRARRNAAPQTTKLSAKGRAGKAPAWPLSVDPEVLREKLTADKRVQRLREQCNETSDRRKLARLERELDSALATADAFEAEIDLRSLREAELWDQLWATPQATMWDANGWLREVALYVRLILQAETGDLKAAAEARQWSDRLGLNQLAMLRLRWEIERTDEAVAAGQARRAAKKAPAKKASGKKIDPRAALYAVK